MNFETFKNNINNALQQYLEFDKDKNEKPDSLIQGFVIFKRGIDAYVLPFMITDLDAQRKELEILFMDYKHIIEPSEFMEVGFVQRYFRYYYSVES